MVHLPLEIFLAPKFSTYVERTDRQQKTIDFGQNQRPKSLFIISFPTDHL